MQIQFNKEIQTKLGSKVDMTHEMWKYDYLANQAKRNLEKEYGGGKKKRNRRYYLHKQLSKSGLKVRARSKEVLVPYGYAAEGRIYSFLQELTKIGYNVQLTISK